jgi:hypothetical protein
VTYLVSVDKGDTSAATAFQTTLAGIVTAMIALIAVRNGNGGSGSQ